MQTVERKLESASLDSIVFQTDNQPADFIVDWFCRWIENYIAGGAEISDGQTLQIGYSLVRCTVKLNILRLESPEFGSMPIRWDANMAPVFQILGWHKYIPESFSFAPDIPTLGQTAIVGKNFDQFPMFGNRLDSTNPNDSGWFFGSTLDNVNNNDPDQLSTVSLYEAMLSIPQMVPYLSMPTDCQIMFNSQTPEILKAYEPLEIKPGSMVDMLHNAN